MKITVAVDPPDMVKLLTSGDRAALRTAGVRMTFVRSSYAATLDSVLRIAYPKDQWTVVVRKHPTGAPRVTTGDGAQTLSWDIPDRLAMAIVSSEAAWCAAVAKITMLFAVAKVRAPK